MFNIVDFKNELLLAGAFETSQRVKDIILSSSRFADCHVTVAMNGSVPRQSTQPNSTAPNTQQDVSAEIARTGGRTAAPAPNMAQFDSPDVKAPNPKINKSQFDCVVGLFWNHDRLNLLIDGKERRRINAYLGNDYISKAREFSVDRPPTYKSERSLDLEGLIEDGRDCMSTFLERKNGTPPNDELRNAQLLTVEYIAELLEVSPHEID